MPNSIAQISLHGDCHRGNVLWRDDKPHFVDFDDAITWSGDSGFMDVAIG